MGSTSLRKGKRGEREAAAELRRLFHVEARRGCQFHGGPDSPDLQTAIEEVHFEVKRTEHLSIYEALGQAAADAGTAVPVVLHRRNSQPWLAIVPLDDLPRLALRLAPFAASPTTSNQGG